MSWWLWILVGTALLVLELLTPGGFFVIFFGVAALIVGALGGLGLVQAAWLQWLWFSVLAVASLLLLRGRLVARMRAGEGSGVGVETLVGEVAVLLDDLEPGTVGKAELRGTSWSVRSRAAHKLARGRRCRVERVEGLMLWVHVES